MLHLSVYSEKAVKISGDTKPHKETLKQLGGRYNPHLNGGPGWIFGRSRLPELETFIQQATAATVNASAYLNPTPPAPVYVAPIETPAPEPFDLKPEEPKQSTPPTPPAPRGKGAQGLGAKIKAILTRFKEIKTIDALTYVKIERGEACATVQDSTSLAYIYTKADDVTGAYTARPTFVPLADLKGAKAIHLTPGAAIIDGCKVLTRDDLSDTYPGTPGGTFERIGAATIPAPLNVDHASKDELRPVMMGVFLNHDKREICTTDAHTLQVVKADIQLSRSVIMPAAAAQLFQGEVVQIYAGQDGCLKLIGGDFICIIREIDGIYPNYRVVIPTDNPNALTLTAGALASLRADIPKAIKAADKTTRRVVLSFQAPDILELSASDIDTGKEYKTTYQGPAIQYNGEPLDIAFNGSFFLRSLKTINPGAVMNMSTASRAALFTDAHGQEVLIMPVMIEP